SAVFILRLLRDRYASFRWWRASLFHREGSLECPRIGRWLQLPTELESLGRPVQSHQFGPCLAGRCPLVQRPNRTRQLEPPVELAANAVDAMAYLELTLIVPPLRGSLLQLEGQISMSTASAALPSRCDEQVHQSIDHSVTAHVDSHSSPLRQCHVEAPASRVTMTPVGPGYVSRGREDPSPPRPQFLLAILGTRCSAAGHGNDGQSSQIGWQLRLWILAQCDVVTTEPASHESKFQHDIRSRRFHAPVPDHSLVIGGDDEHCSAAFEQHLLQSFQCNETRLEDARPQHALGLRILQNRTHGPGLIEAFS